jgi:hypothetical protein
MEMTSGCTGSDFFDRHEVVDVVDQAVLVAVGHRARLGLLDLPARRGILVVAAERDVGDLDARRGRVTTRRMPSPPTRSSTRLIVRPLLRKAICWKRARIVS